MLDAHVLVVQHGAPAAHVADEALALRHQLHGRHQIAAARSPSVRAHVEVPIVGLLVPQIRIHRLPLVLALVLIPTAVTIAAAVAALALRGRQSEHVPGGVGGPDLADLLLHPAAVVRGHEHVADAATYQHGHLVQHVAQRDGGEGRLAGVVAAAGVRVAVAAVAGQVVRGVVAVLREVGVLGHVHDAVPAPQMHGHARGRGVQPPLSGRRVAEGVQDLGHSRAIQGALAQQEGVHKGRGVRAHVAEHASVLSLLVASGVGQVVRQREVEGRRGLLAGVGELGCGEGGLAVVVNESGVDDLTSWGGGVQHQREACVLLHDAQRVSAGGHLRWNKRLVHQIFGVYEDIYSP